MKYILIVLWFLFVEFAFAGRGVDADFIKSTDHTKTWTPPASTDTLVGRSSTDTLTNKSISGSTNTLTNIPLSSAVTGQLPLANGGTAANITASHGGLAFSTASAISIGPVGTSGQIATSSGAGAPAWITTVPVANGGTGANTLTANNVILGNGTSAVTFVAPGSSGNILQSNGTTWTSVPAGAGTGDVVGPASSVSGAIATFQGTSGKSIHQSSLTGIAALSSGVLSTSATVSLPAGGTGANLTAVNGGLVYSTSSAFAITAVGISGQYAKSNAAVSAPAFSFPGYVSKAGSYTASTDDETINFSADATLTLPAAASYTGKIYRIVSGSATVEVTIDPNSSETVCGQTTVRLEGQEAISIQSNGANWIGLDGGCWKRMEAYIVNSGSCSVSSQSGTWITSVSDPGVGQCGMTWSSATWSIAPKITWMPIAGTGCTTGGPLNTPATTGMTMLTQSGSAVSTDCAFHIFASGPR